MASKKKRLNFASRALPTRVTSRAMQAPLAPPALLPSRAGDASRDTTASAPSRRAALASLPAAAALLAALPSRASAGSVLELTPETFDGVVRSNKRVFVEFYAPWCPYCKRMEPMLSALPGKLGGKTRVARMDVDAHADYAQRYGVSGFPTLVLFLDGVPAGQHVGLVDEETLLRFAKAEPQAEPAGGGQRDDEASLDLVLTRRAQGALSQELAQLREELRAQLPADTPALARVDTIAQLVTGRLL
jgi:thioredoxin-like negative regulator of GroEL